MNDTAAALWDNYYLVRIPYIQSTSVEYMKLVGTYTTTHKDIDQALAGQWITSMLPISKIVDYYKDGCQVKIVKESDIKEIYEHISRHLEAWLDQLTYGVNIGGAPIEDLIAMDQFANEVYSHAKYHFTNEVVNSLLVNKLIGESGVNASNFLKNVSLINGYTPPLIKANYDQDLPERVPLENALKEHLGNVRRILSR